MAAYAFQGLCYATPAAALTAFNNQYPIIGDNNMTSLVSSAITSSGVIGYMVNTRPLTSNNLYSRTGSLSLATCTKPDVPYDYTGAGAIWAFFFTTTLGFWLVAKKAGLILEAVRKW